MNWARRLRTEPNALSAARLLSVARPNTTNAERGRWADALAAAFVLLLALVNAVLLPRALEALLAGAPAVDWQQLVEGGRRVFGEGLYDSTDTYGFRYSPVAGYLFAVIGGMGTLAWRFLHVVAALALPTWPMRLVTLASWPFWYDVETGNILIFVLLAAAWAVRGSNLAVAAFVVVGLLFPRPLMLPVAAWIVWQRPDWRLPILVLAVAHVAAVALTGWGDEWVARLLTLGAEASSPNNLGPSRLLGTAWLLIGIPLAAVLTWRGRLGWASLAVSHPYVLPYYLLMLVLELPRRFFPRRTDADA